MDEKWRKRRDELAAKAKARRDETDRRKLIEMTERMRLEAEERI
jgi:hypothetical protein